VNILSYNPGHDGAIAYSIPNIYRFTDSNGDGRADIGKKILGKIIDHFSKEN